MLLNIGLFVLQAVCVFFSSIFLLRFYCLLIRLNISRHSPELSRFVFALTDWAVLSLRKIIPSIRSVDLSSLLPAVIFQLILALVKSALIMGQIDLISNSFHALVASVDLIIGGLIGILIISVVLSWVQPASAVHYLLSQLSAPILNPIRRFLPSIGGVDLSPLFALLFLQIMQMLIASLGA
jgi:YggT family protein